MKAVQGLMKFLLRVIFFSELLILDVKFTK